MKTNIGFYQDGRIGLIKGLKPGIKINACQIYKILSVCAYGLHRSAIHGTSTVNPTISATCVVTVTHAKDDTGVHGIGANISALGNGSLPVNDVTARDYFYDAVLWAVEHGITKGTSAKTFSPDATVTRAQVVTFLYRAN